VLAVSDYTDLITLIRRISS